jgi:ABC-2 type transport system ATP-binding protein
MIEARQLCKRYGRREAVRDLSFTVGKGEIVGFLGPNGAGKTSTLRMLTGYSQPTSGSASIDGFDIIRDSLKARARIGYMPENVPLYEDMRVREYLSFRARLKGLSGRDARQRVGEVVEMCGIAPVRRCVIRTLSKGYRQRVGLADALVHDPGLLILDEPTNGLDPNQIRQVRALIRGLAGSRTILLSTHILSEVEMVCDRVIILDKGRMAASGVPADLAADLRAAGRIRVELRSGDGDAAARIGALKHVRKTVSEPMDDGWTALTVWVEAGTDTRERIAALAASEGWALRTLLRHEASLEDVFVELTRHD